MKNKIKAIFISIIVTLSVMPFSTVNAFFEKMWDEPYPFEILSSNYYNKEIDYSLWNKFLKYDLCITDYDSLNDEEQKLCYFIFEKERSAQGTIRCERARRILAGDKGLSERIDPDFNGCIQTLEYNYVPDIIHLDNDITVNEYWIDDDGTQRILTGRSYYVFVNFEIEEAFKKLYEEHCNENYVNIYPSDLDDEHWAICLTDKTVLSALPIEVNNAFEIEYDGDTYYILPDNIAVLSKSKYKNYSSYNDEPIIENILIPQTVNGYPVTGIERDAFKNSSITNITLPDTISFINKYAFMGCKYLENINFPESLEKIGEYTFKECINLREINLDCPNLNISKFAFENSGLTKATINVKSIDENTFENCKNLDTVTLNEGLESIKANAFNGCANLKNIELPSTLRTIGQGAFYGTSIKSITIPSTVEILGILPERIGYYSGGWLDVPATDPLTEEPELIVNKDCIIYGYYNTEAHYYAISNKLKFIPLDENILYGDTNNDGEINMSDAVVLQSYLIGCNISIGYEADLNQDGKVNVFDMIMLKRMLMKKL